MVQEAGGCAEAWTPSSGLQGAGVAVLAYRSRAVQSITDADLDKILRSAQARNHAEGLTGVLIYDQGLFYQWLEGPTLALMRVWDSIRRDPRHDELTVLRQHHLPRRLFKGWDLRLARRTRGVIDSVLATMTAPNDLLSQLRIQPSVLAGSSWDSVLGEAVIPQLQAARGQPSAKPPKLPSTDTVWHAQRGAGAALGELLLAMDPAQTAGYVDGLVDQGAQLGPLYHEVFEPAARYLGGLWEDDCCNDFSVSLAMGRLQMEVRRLSNSIPGDYVVQPGHAILVASQPGETHGLSAAMCSELFARDGWDVSYEITCSDKSLRDILHNHWFDVLELSLSDAMLREQQLPAMRLTIRAARAASLNPGLAVIVDGRSFFERPRAYLDVGADIGCSTSTEAVPAAQHLVDDVATRIRFSG